MLKRLIVLTKDALWKLGSIPFLGPVLKFFYSISLIIRNHKLFCDFILSYPRFAQETSRSILAIQDNLKTLGAKVRRSEFSLFIDGKLKHGAVVEYRAMEPFALQTYDPRADEYISAELQRFGVWDRHLSEWLLERLNGKSALFIDAGANIGYFSILASYCLKGNSKVVAFEPDPNNLELLRKNIEINSIRMIQVEPLALSDSSGSAKLYISPTNKGDHRLTQDDGRNEIQIQSTTLDAWWARYKAKGFETPELVAMKIDVQGSEAYLIKGIKKCLNDWPNFVAVIEITPNFIRQNQIDFHQFAHEVFELGLQVHLLSSMGIWLPDSPKIDSKMFLKLLEDPFYSTGGDLTIELRR